jgi:hypothetical protein
LKRKKQLTKGKKIKRIKVKLKKNNINFDWRMKLNTNKTLTKDPNVKITNQKNKDRIRENNIWQIVI